MKTQIITLESHDDLISVRDKLSWAKTPRILLVWPKFEKVPLRFLDLKVLQRHAESLGAQVGLITRRAAVRRDAEALGIPVFDSTAAAQKETWPEPVLHNIHIHRPPRRDLRKIRGLVYETEAAWRRSPAGRVIAFTFGVMAVLTIAGVFVPHATVILYPGQLVQSITLPVSAGESISSASITGSVPARVISTTVSGEQSLAIVNEISVPNSKARGIARFKNLTESEVVIPAGTVVSTAGEIPVRYVTQHETLIQPGSDEFVDVPIEAIPAGSIGNAPTNTIVIVEGQLGVSVAVTNPKLVAGGTDSKLIGATDADRGKLRDAVMKNLIRDAQAELRAQISTGDLFLPDTFELSGILEESYDPPVGATGKKLTLKMRAEFVARYISEIDLTGLATSALNTTVPDGYTSSNAVTYTPATDPTTDTAGITRFDVQVSRSLLRKVDGLQVFSIVRGRKPGGFDGELISTLALRDKPAIILRPSWWPWMPLIPFNIAVETR